MSNRLGSVLLVVFLLNLILVYVIIYSLWNRQNSFDAKLLQNNTALVDNQKSIANLINQKDNISPIPPPPEVNTPTPSPKTPNYTSKRNRLVQYLPIPGSGSTLENKWIDLPGTEFYISTNDYPNLVGAYFEANMKLVNGNGLAFLRLFDITTGVEVWGSEVSTSSQSFTSVSSNNLTIRQGTHLYRVQAKSLTADTTVYNSGRIKIIFETN